METDYKGPYIIPLWIGEEEVINFPIESIYLDDYFQDWRNPSENELEMFSMEFGIRVTKMVSDTPQNFLTGYAAGKVYIEGGEMFCVWVCGEDYFEYLRRCRGE